MQVCMPLLLLFLLYVFRVDARDGGLARTPPMGWADWERFRCNRDCANHPKDCIGERLIMDMADRMSEDGFLAAGYEYLNLGDCWSERGRDPVQRRMIPAARQFPHGIPALAKYVHSKGLKFGMATDYGTTTCDGYPGMKYYMQRDAEQFAGWGVDYIKLDNCNSGDYHFTGGYPPVNFYLDLTNRSILLSCEFPHYQIEQGLVPDFASAREVCNMARVWHDIQDSWPSVLEVINLSGENHYNFSSYAQPGYWNDADMLVIGNFGLSYDQQRTQFGMWAIMAAPLIMSTDLRKISNESRALLLNRNIISIDQDSLGKQGERVATAKNKQVWLRLLSKNRWAIALLYTGTDMPTEIAVKLSSIGLNNKPGYKVYEAFENRFVGKFAPADQIKMYVNPTGIWMGVLIPV